MVDVEIEIEIEPDPEPEAPIEEIVEDLEELLPLEGEENSPNTLSEEKKRLLSFRYPIHRLRLMFGRLWT